MPERSPVSFACPSCLAALTATAQGFSCRACGSSYRVTDGIPLFQQQPTDFFWGVPQERMRRMLEDARTVGWHDAFLTLCRELPPAEADRLWLRSFGYRRGAIQLLLPMTRRPRVLDFGCGWGAITVQLAPRAEHVVAMDQSPLHLQWVRASAAERALTNITLVQGGDTPHLPFPDGSFDAIVLNGVLEHVAVSRRGNPRRVQRDFLRECARLLTADGVLYVGIENRLNYKYFLGVREGHIAMKYGALLPRWVTHAYLMATRNRPYREYTYSLRGYRRLLHSAGLPQQRFFAPWPSYGSAGNYFPVGDTVRTPVWQVETSHPASRFPGWHFARAFAVTAAKGESQTPLFEEVMRVVAQRTGRSLPWTVRKTVFDATSGGKATIQAAMPDGPDWLIQIGVAPLASSRIQNQYRAMAHIHASAAPDDVKRRVPVPIATGDVAGYFYGVRPYPAGQRATALAGDERRRSRLCDDALQFLVAFQSSDARRVTFGSDESVAEELVRAPFRSVRQWFTAAEWRTHGPWFDEQRAWVEDELRGASLPIVPSHGDFVPENCVRSESNDTLTCVIDWELFDPRTLPLLDWITFVGGAHTPDIKAAMRRRGEDPAQARYYGYPDAFLRAPLLDRLHDYLDRMEIDRRTVRPLLFMWWVRQMHDWAALLQYHPDWRRLRIFPVIDRWTNLPAPRLVSAP